MVNADDEVDFISVFHYTDHTDGMFTLVVYTHNHVSSVDDLQ